MRLAHIPVGAAVEHCCQKLRTRLDHSAIRRGLVIGCGTGDEAAYLSDSLGVQQIVGLDIEQRFSLAARGAADLVITDAKHLPFSSETFDFAAAIHSLEHVGDPHLALSEVHRVLRRGSLFYVGVPNKCRAVGYLGSFDATPWQKIAWNAKDYMARLRGKYENALGAHAGFGGQELVNLLGMYFGDVELLTEEYLRSKYSHRIPVNLLQVLLQPAVIAYSAPAHYALCRKR